MTTTLLMLVLAAAPRVDSVVVYPDRAQVTRAAEVTCVAGTTRVTFEGITPAADQTTLRAAAKNAQVEGLRSEKRTRAEAFSSKLTTVEQQLRKAEDELRALNDQAARIANRSNLGTQFENVAVQLISRDVAVSKPDTRAWTSAFDASLNARLDAATQSAELQGKRRTLGWRIEDLRREQAQLQGAASRNEYVAEVLVSCPAGRPARVELTYLVGGASWTPAYEARSEEPSHVAITTWATVVQSTGEDWNDAKVILSTAVPAQDATPPELQPLKVYAEELKEKKVLVRREEKIEHARTGSLSPSGGTDQHLRAAAQGLSVQLAVPGQSDVKGDGTPARLLVARTRMPATFAWRSVPTLAPFAFRVADLTNNAPFPLLEGAVDAFGRSGGFMGRYPLERVPQGGAFHLTFGLEDSVKVERVVVEEISRAAGLFNQKKRFNYAYRFEVANYTGKPLEVELQDRVPVSELQDISVELEKGQTTAGYVLQPQDGTVTWKVKLSSGEKKQVNLRFHVDVPDSYDTAGL